MDWNAALYRKSHGFVAEYGKNLLACVPEDASQCILDFGCGTGELTAALGPESRAGDRRGPVRRHDPGGARKVPRPEYHVLDAAGLAVQGWTAVSTWSFPTRFFTGFRIRTRCCAPCMRF